MSVLRIAHRGASGYAPENTLVAFQRALDLGVDMIEFDVRATRDGELVVFHDARLERLTGGQGRLDALTYDELSDYQVAGEPIPRLVDVLSALGSRCQINIEIKQRGLVDAIVAEVRRLGLQRHVIFSSLRHGELLKVKAIDPLLRVGALLNVRPVLALTAISVARAIDAEALIIPRAVFRPAHLRAAHRAGLAVYVWTVNEPEEIAWARELGVDGIFSNYPDLI